MENIILWYLTDNENGKKTVAMLKGMSLTVNLIEDRILDDTEFDNNKINIFIFDLENVEPRELIKYCVEDQRLRGRVKFVISDKKSIKSALSEPFNLYRLEFIKRPLDVNEFLLLIEKTVLVEYYRAIVKLLSNDYDNSIGALEDLLSIGRKNIFESAGKDKFEDIVNYQNNSIEENYRLKKSMENFLIMYGGEISDSIEQIDATQLLLELRKKDMKELEGIYDERKNVIDDSFGKPKRMVMFYDSSDIDNMDVNTLRETLKKERSLSTMLAQEIEFLLKELDSI